jgi:integrating conjugative element protein (TIGR03758 family)
MTPAQSAAFQAGAGVAPGALLTAIASVVVVLTFVWVMWVTVGSFRAWQGGQIALLDLVWASLRASIVLLALGFYLR